KGNHRGFVRLIIDKKTNALSFERFYWNDMANFINVGKGGEVENGYSLYIRDIYMMEDGKVGILFEKFKMGGAYSVSKTTDLVHLVTDSNFKITDVRVLEKAKSKFNTSDYMFS